MTPKLAAKIIEGKEDGKIYHSYIANAENFVFCVGWLHIVDVFKSTSYHIKIKKKKKLKEVH
jgi:hypothetical protein